MLFQNNPAGNYMFKVNNKDTIKDTINKDTILVSLLLTLNMFHTLL